MPETVSQKSSIKKKLSFHQFFSFILSRAFVVGFLLVIEAALVFLIINNFFGNSQYFYFFSMVFSVSVVVFIVSNKDNPNYKLAWSILILLLPPMGAIIYLFSGKRTMSRMKKLQIKTASQKTAALLGQDKLTWQKVRRLPADTFQQINYLKTENNFAIYQKTETKYLPVGERFFDELKKELRKAKKFIFLEFYIIQEGIMWDSVLEILKEKVAEGVEIRLMYDDVGCLFTLPTNYVKRMNSYGIKTQVFNRFRPILDMQMNNRDHRKIVVVDGKVGFVSGINLADEYINAYPKHGHWKDTGVMLKGDAVWSLTVMYLQFWNAYYRHGDSNYLDYKVKTPANIKDDGYVQPFCDSPEDDELVSKNVILNAINKAVKYIYFTSPYLIIDNELITALSNAAKNGVDVRIITPGIGDKWYVHYLTQSFYAQLIEAGVKIYEYLPGFIHAKSFLADDQIGMVGTINMDYRSLYLQFECGVLMYKSIALRQLKDDLLKTMDESELISLYQVNEVKLLTRITRGILRVFAPLV